MNIPGAYRADNAVSRLFSEYARQRLVTRLPPPSLRPRLKNLGIQGKIRQRLQSFPMVEDPLELTLFAEAIDLFRATRRTGETVRSGTDCLIAACALRHNLEVLHRDRDYPVIAKISGLRQRRL
jgi:predicted nucleic acid-binding protein